MDPQPQPLLRVALDFQGEEKQQFQLNKSEQAHLLFDYDKMRKKILQLYKYKASGINSIQLVITNFYTRATVQIPIHHPKNYKFIVGDMVDREVDSLELKVRVLGELSKRKRREKQAPIEFDSDGSVESVEDETIKRCLEENKPKMAPFQGQKLVRCCFCKYSIRQGGQCKTSGPFYGPMIGKYYGHLLCLLWCSDVYLDDNAEFKGIEAAINNIMKVKCNYCSKNGASFYCHTKSCMKSGHYGCAMKHNWYFNWSKYTTYCTKCAVHYRPAAEESPGKESIQMRKDEGNVLKGASNTKIEEPY